MTAASAHSAGDVERGVLPTETVAHQAGQELDRSRTDLVRREDPSLACASFRCERRSRREV